MTSKVMDDFESQLSESLGELAGRAVVPDIDAAEIAGWASGEVLLLNRVDTQVSVAPRRWWPVAAAIVLVIGLGVIVSFASDGGEANPPASERSWLVLPGEEVLSTDPLVVAAAPSPELEFDTSPLGDEIVLEPIGEADVRTFINLLAPEARGTLRKVVVLGSFRDDPFFLTITDIEGIEGLRERAAFGSSGGSGSGEYVDLDSLELIEFPDHRNSPIPNITGLGVGPGGGQVVWDRLPSDVAVVAYEDADEKVWLRPAAGVAIVPAQLVPGERFELTAYSAEGERLGMAVGTADFGDEAYLAPEGRRVGPVRGYDFDGNEIWIGSDGRTKLFLFGASWCVPCEGLSEVVDGVLAAHPHVDTYAVDFAADSRDVASWPIDPDWADRRITLADTAMLHSALPTLYLLDGDNVVVGSHVGRDGLAEWLENELTEEG